MTYINCRMRHRFAGDFSGVICGCVHNERMFALQGHEAVAEELETNKTDKKEAETARNGGSCFPLLRGTILFSFEPCGVFHNAPAKLHSHKASIEEVRAPCAEARRRPRQLEELGAV